MSRTSRKRRALQGIRLTTSLFPAATFLIGVVCLFFYKIDRRLEIQITDELAERRRAYGAVAIPFGVAKAAADALVTK
jgi:Na+/melibiose symporter-like transporter